MSERAGKPLSPAELVQSLDEKELTQLAYDKGAKLPTYWDQFPIRAKRIAVQKLLDGGYTKLGFEILEPDFLETLKRIGAEAREALRDIEILETAEQDPKHWN